MQLLFQLTAMCGLERGGSVKPAPNTYIHESAGCHVEASVRTVPNLFAHLCSRRALAIERAALAFLSCVALGVAGGARAHDYFFERAGDELVLLQGHESSAHAGDEAVPYDASIVQHARCIDAEGRLLTLPKPTASPARFAGNCALLFVATSSGYWSETDGGTVNQPKTEAAGASYSWSSEESIKLLEQWLPSVAAPLGVGFELTTADNPLTLVRNDKVRVRVTWHGEPRSGRHRRVRRRAARRDGRGR